MLRVVDKQAKHRNPISSLFDSLLTGCPFSLPCVINPATLPPAAARLPRARGRPEEEDAGLTYARNIPLGRAMEVLRPRCDWLACASLEYLK